MICGWCVREGSKTHGRTLVSALETQRKSGRTRECSDVTLRRSGTHGLEHCQAIVP